MACILTWKMKNKSLVDGISRMIWGPGDLVPGIHHKPCMTDMLRLRMGISETSALVLLLADGAVHTSKSARTYLESLNLNAGRELFQRCNDIWDHYDEVIKNRKHCILNVARQAVRQNITQMAILGAGYDALSLELLHHHGKLRIYEADSENMRHKEELVRHADAALGSRILCVEADLRDPAGLADALASRGWSRSMPSLVVLEGVSYYLKKEVLRGILGAFENNGQNCLLLEYLMPQHLIAEERAGIPAEIFGMIQGRYGVPLSRYDAPDIAAMVGSAGRVTRVFDLKEMEMERTGKNTHFASSESGWIQICKILV